MKRSKSQSITCYECFNDCLSLVYHLIHSRNNFLNLLDNYNRKSKCKTTPYVLFACIILCVCV